MSEDDLRGAWHEFTATIAAALPTAWLSRHAWWIRNVCAIFLLGVALYLSWIGEALAAAFFAALVLWGLGVPAAIRRLLGPGHDERPRPGPEE